MREHSPDRLEIFLALRLEQTAKRGFTEENSSTASEATADFMLPSNSETELFEETIAEKFPALANYLSEPEIERFERVRADYQSKTEAERNDWRRQILKKIGTDEDLIDECVHRSHIDAALEKEIPAVQKIVAAHLPQSYKKSTDTFTGRKKKVGETAELKLPTENAPLSNTKKSLEKMVRRQFARQFVAVRDLENPTAFDYLSGAHLARLIRLTGIREIALACVRIEAVESVAAFLRIFSTEDAQAIAAQLNRLTGFSDERLSFAEHLVQTTLEAEPQPSAMLDLLGIRLVGISLCPNSNWRVRYTIQKLPLEIAPKLPEIIAEQSVETPVDLQRKISDEIERLAETLVWRAN